MPALVPLEGGDDDDAHLGGRARVRAAAGLAVEALGLDDPHVGLDALGRPQALGAGLGRGERRDPHRARLPHDLVGAPLRRAGLVGGHGPVEVDGGDLGAEVEGDRLRARHLDEGLREQVLPVVLLHVVAAPLARPPRRAPARRPAAGRARGGRPPRPRAPRRRARRRACPCPRAGRRSPRRRRCGRGRRRAGPRARAGRPRPRRTRGGRDRRRRVARSSDRAFWHGARRPASAPSSGGTGLTGLLLDLHLGRGRPLRPRPCRSPACRSRGPWAQVLTEALHSVSVGALAPPMHRKLADEAFTSTGCRRGR